MIQFAVLRKVSESKLKLGTLERYKLKMSNIFSKHSRNNKFKNLYVKTVFDEINFIFLFCVIQNQ